MAAVSSRCGFSQNCGLHILSGFSSSVPLRGKLRTTSVTEDNSEQQIEKYLAAFNGSVLTVRTPKPDDSDDEPEIHPIDKRLQQEAVAPESRRRASFRFLQFLSHTFESESDARNAEWDYGSRLEYSRIARD